MACKSERHRRPRPNSPSSPTKVYGETLAIRSSRPRIISGSYGARGKFLHSSSQEERRSFVGTMDTPRSVLGSSKATTPYCSTTSSQVNMPAGGAPNATALGNTELRGLDEENSSSSGRARAEV